MKDLQRTKNSSFVGPYFIEILDSEGLMGIDIAKSLSMTQKEVLDHIHRNDFLARFDRQGFRAVPFEGDIAFDTNAAKFFVGKFDSPEGDGYLGFLINMEVNVGIHNDLIKTDPILMQLSAAMKQQVQIKDQERRLQVQEKFTAGLATTLDTKLGDMNLSYNQQVILKEQIDNRAFSIAFGDKTAIGRLTRDLKEYIGLNKTNHTWKDIPQRRLNDALRFVQRWPDGN